MTLNCKFLFLALRENVDSEKITNNVKNKSEEHTAFRMNDFTIS